MKNTELYEIMNMIDPSRSREHKELMKKLSNGEIDSIVSDFRKLTFLDLVKKYGLKQVIDNAKLADSEDPERLFKERVCKGIEIQE